MLINSPSGWQASLTILGRNSFKPMSVAVEKRGENQHPLSSKT